MTEFEASLAACVWPGFVGVLKLLGWTPDVHGKLLARDFRLARVELALTKTVWSESCGFVNGWGKTGL